MSKSTVSETDINVALRLIDDAWEELRRSPYVQERLGIAPLRLPDISITEVERRSRMGRSLLEGVAAINLDTLPHDLALTLRLVRFRAQVWARAVDWYWTVIDPFGDGFFGMFLPAAYCGGFLLSFVNRQLAEFRFVEDGDSDRYLGLVADYAQLIEQFAVRTAGQAERGMRAPKAQVLQMRALMRSLKSGARAAAAVAPERNTMTASRSFCRELEARIATRLEPAFDAVLSVLSDEYFAAAPDSVGLGQYDGGREIYDTLVKLHTTLDLTPEEVHQRGVDRMAELERAMRAMRTELGFEEDGAAYIAHLNRDPRWRADTVDAVAAVFQRYIDRFEPVFDEYFSAAPKATYRVTPLPEALQGSMTYGYYDSPRPGINQGLYLFNSGYLTKQALLNVGSLTYHELVPGHHLQISLQQENSLLHPFRVYSLVNAYNEGWAEYAATLAGEVGMYELAEERYGRLMMDAFLTCRLVVDTGMNVLGWSARPCKRLYAHAYRNDRSRDSDRVGALFVRHSRTVPGV